MAATSKLAVIQRDVNPLAILQQAVEKGASMEQVTTLMGLAERWEANEARKAFAVAFAAFKADAVTIARNVLVTDGPLKGRKYANLFGVVDAVIPALSQHGLSHSWKLTKDEPAWMEVTCTVRHVLGHSETVAMGAAPDTGPGRNAIQARGSAKSYLERYTLLAATGLASADQDDDGAAAGLTEAQHNLVDDILKAADMADLQNVFAAAWRTTKDAKIRKAYSEAKDRRKAQLSEAA